MTPTNYIASAFAFFGAAAWSAIAVAKRFQADFPAPANDVSGSDGCAAAARLPHGVSMTSAILRQGLPEVPLRMRSLPVDSRGYPIPYFAASAARKPGQPGADAAKLAECVYFKRCWLCGQALGRYKAFVVEPLRTISRLTCEPPSHTDCAKFAAAAAPLLTGDSRAVAVWVTRDVETIQQGDDLLIRMGEPEQTFWYASGRLASRDEIRASFEAALPKLYEFASADGDAAIMELDIKVARASRHMPPHAAAAHVG
jgi:hypothetical protein